MTPNTNQSSLPQLNKSPNEQLSLQELKMFQLLFHPTTTLAPHEAAVVQVVPCADFGDIAVLQNQEDPTKVESIRVILTILYFLLFLFGLFGNTTMIYTIVRQKQLKKARVVFMLNLLIADLMLCFLSLPVTPTVYVMKQWIFGALLCYLLSCTQSVAVMVSIWSLSVVVLNKYLHIVNYTPVVIRPRNAVYITIFVWCASFLLSVPYIHVTQLIDGSIYSNALWPAGFCGSQCIEQWPPDRLYRKINSIGFLMLNLIIPSILISFCYWRILMKIRRDMVAGEHEFASSLTIEQLRRSQARKRRIIRTSIAVIVMFISAWLPMLLRNFLRDFELEPEFFFRHEISVSMFTHFCAMTTVFSNPLLIWWLGRQTNNKKTKQVKKSYLTTNPNSTATLNNNHKQSRMPFMPSSRTSKSRSVHSMHQSLLVTEPSNGTCNQHIPQLVRHTKSTGPNVDAGDNKKFPFMTSSLI